MLALNRDDPDRRFSFVNSFGGMCLAKKRFIDLIVQSYKGTLHSMQQLTDITVFTGLKNLHISEKKQVNLPRLTVLHTITR